MEFNGVVYKKLPEVTGSSAKGAWKKQDVVFEIPGEYSRKACVTFFGDRADDAASLQEGESVTVHFNLESREFNGRWYNDVRAWKIVRVGAPVAPAASYGAGVGAPPAYSHPAAPAVSPEAEGFAASPAEEVDDLPF